MDVVTGDRDLFQLVDDARAVRVLYTARGVANLEIMDAAAIQARYGITPTSTPTSPPSGATRATGRQGLERRQDRRRPAATFGTLEALLDAAAARDLRLARYSGKLNAARDYLTRAPDVVRTVRTLDLPDVDTTLAAHPQGPRQARGPRRHMGHRQHPRPRHQGARPGRSAGVTITGSPGEGCDMLFEVQVPLADFYRLEVSHRGQRSCSRPGRAGRLAGPDEPGSPS